MTFSSSVFTFTDGCGGTSTMLKMFNLKVDTAFTFDPSTTPDHQ